MTTLSEALTAYRICARAERKSPKTIEWVASAVGYFADFLGGDQEIGAITADDLRRFIIALQESHKFRNHPFNKPQQEKLSPQCIETYAQAQDRKWRHWTKSMFDREGVDNSRAA